MSWRWGWGGLRYGLKEVHPGEQGVTQGDLKGGERVCVCVWGGGGVYMAPGMGRRDEVRV